MTPRTQVLVGGGFVLGWVGLHLLVGWLANNPTAVALVASTFCLCWIARGIFELGRPR